MMRHAVLMTVTLVAIACGRGGGSRDTGPTPVDASLGPATSVTLCGSVSTPTDSCPNFPNNMIEMRVSGGNGVSCPCFTFKFLDQDLSDQGTSNRNYGFTGFRPGTYQVSGQVSTGQLGFTFWHNATTSAIGVVPSSIQSLTGSVGTPFNGCSVQYRGPNPGQPPASFSFQFTVANVVDGGSC